MQVSVLIPTNKRPDTLRSAIDSVNNQSRRDLIKEVLVSDNGGSPGTEAICGEFSSLPISYFRRKADQGFAENIKFLAMKAKSQFVALLADDDMWSRYHLEESTHLLNRFPESAGCFSQAAFVQDESRQILKGLRELPSLTLRGENGVFVRDLQIGTDQMFVECLLHTPVFFWSFVGQTTAFRSAVNKFTDPTLGVDSDRLFVWNLSTQGNLVLSPEATYLVRSHDDMEGRKIFLSNPKFHLEQMRRHTAQIVDEARLIGIEPQRAWESFWSRFTEGNAASFLANSTNPQSQFVNEFIDLKGTCRKDRQQINIKLIFPQIYLALRRAASWLRCRGSR